MDGGLVERLAGYVIQDNNTGPLVRIIISGMLSISSIDQAIARNVLNRCQEVDPDRLFMNLALVVQDCHQKTGIRTLAAHLLKEHLVELQHTGIPVDGRFYLMWDRITRENRNLIKSILLRCVQQQETTERCLMLKLCDTISSLASWVIPNWPELYMFIHTGLSSDSPCEAALLIFAESPMFVLGCLGVGGLKGIKDVLSRILANDNLTTDLKIAALRAAIKFISSLENRSIFQDLVTPIMNMTNAVMAEDETNGQEVLGLLNGMDPNFLMKEQRPSWLVLGSALEIAETDNLEEGTKHLAIDFMIKLVESAPDKIFVMAPFIRRFLSLMLKMMSDIEDEPDWYTSTSEESSNYLVGKQCFARVATAVDGYAIFPVVSELLRTYLTASNWENNHAALIALAEISYGCREVMNDNIELLASMAINSVQNRHPRVRWAAANLIFHLAEVFSSFRAQYRQRVQNALAPVMNDPSYQRVQEKAADAYHRLDRT